MLRVRDERRRMRQVEVLRQQKEEEREEREERGQSCGGERRGGGRATAELLGNTDEGHGGVFSTMNTSKSQLSPKTTSHTAPSTNRATHKEVRCF